MQNQLVQYLDIVIASFIFLLSEQKTAYFGNLQFALFIETVPIPFLFVFQKYPFFTSADQCKIRPTNVYKIPHYCQISNPNTSTAASNRQELDGICLEIASVQTVSTPTLVIVPDTEGRKSSAFSKTFRSFDI